MFVAVGKYRPFEPESTKLRSYTLLLNVVVKFPALSRARTVAFPRPLFDCVPMPNMSEPVADGAPPAWIAGSSMIVPLLSPANIHTGFCTCCERVTAVVWQV